MTLAKLQNPVKASFDSLNDSLKETHSTLNKYTKALDKVGQYFQGKRRAPKKKKEKVIHSDAV